ncbi:hypothetical protein CP985_12025 [Malaciobacter mytili LMG 24559]|uniref:ATPase AAA-type core domain-containing protein n=1 Tax=Malaciobacter mytili LMG 24559 TaxID=1032238 RepID=A0AAX2AEG7_9BACT|nr:AAA family ATPase [Malaciobacter mytili]AXH15181.1 ATP-binding protein (AAA domain) [Malaciobacter mytili LMG 24559]RXK14787.1 hypothetical protein CP985_12025 [Malaciobacter mytili LMG 24559]
MELVYLWIEEYKNIKKQGFNFSSKFDCNFFPRYEKNCEDITCDKMIDGCKLKITAKNNINIFPEKINLTTIAGENGSGKSSLLEVLSNKYDPIYYRHVFFIFFDKVNRRLSLHGALRGGVFDYIFIDELEDNNEFYIKVVSDMQKVENTKSVYLSNLLNENDLMLPIFSENNSYSNMVNISTSHLLNQRKLIETKTQGANSESMTGFDKVYRSYRIQQIQSAIIAIQNGLIVPFKLPEKLVIKNINFEGLFEKIIKDSNNIKFNKILEVIKNHNNEETIFKNYVKMNLVIALLLENKDLNNPISEELVDIVLGLKMGSTLEEFYDNVSMTLKGYEFFIDENTKATTEYTENFFKNADKLLRKIEELNIRHTLVRNRYEIELDIKSNNFDFLEIYEKMIQQSEYFWDISWRGLSSGEETFLYQFSRLFFLEGNYKDNPFMNLKVENKEVENIILLIDEGEVTLHPEWQKSYIKYLIEFLERNFTQNIHLILTTHSPFILSDMPKDNIVFLEKGKQVYPEIDTFGANIHTLLSHGFFMREGLMGEFAKQRLEQILNYLTKGIDNIDLSQQEIKYTIDLVGEELLKRKLENLYNEFYGIVINKEDEYLKRIKELEAQLEERDND